MALKKWELNMWIRRIFAFLLLLWTFASTAMAQETVRVQIQTEAGNIDVELYPDKAPGTVANFLRHVDAGFYEGGRFHRTVTLDNQPNNDVLIEVIQAGINPDRGGEGFDPIPLERTSVTVLRHEEGAISMSRGGPDTARSPSYSSGSILPGATVVAAPLMIVGMPTLLYGLFELT